MIVLIEYSIDASDAIEGPVKVENEIFLEISLPAQCTPFSLCEPQLPKGDGGS